MSPLPLWGNPIRVNTTAGQGQAVPDIAVLPGGHFAIIWADTQADRPSKTDYWLSYRLQTFDALGNPLGNEV
ncbi:hypothetical protein [Mesorhizobium amorphae]|uniref:hypothetical protein n=1 Tax=Mesorhizobium amorphae TaxID=71433 RepID=UPI001186DAF9|nr:hypothetical protein [Mesorhizobium amorphae]